MSDTTDPLYAKRLERLGSIWWKQLLDVQRPYRWNLKRLNLGRTLDVGCGVGRNLKNLGRHSVGVDHNLQCVAEARAIGLTAYTPDEFFSAANPASFDSLLVAHVLEHLSEADADDLLRTYLPFLKSSSKVVLITPQEAGYKTDATHVRFVDFQTLREHARRANLTVGRLFSFPLPRLSGVIFPYNEFVAVCQKH